MERPRSTRANKTSATEEQQHHVIRKRTELEFANAENARARTQTHTHTRPRVSQHGRIDGTA
jgi:hypothetical protein